MYLKQPNYMVLKELKYYRLLFSINFPQIVHFETSIITHLLHNNVPSAISLPSYTFDRSPYSSLISSSLYIS